MDDLTIRPMSAERWDDLVALFGTRGDPSWCWCQFFVSKTLAHDRAVNQESLRAQVAASDRPLGLLAYGGGVPIGWLAVGPLGSYSRLVASRSLADARGHTSTEKVWRTTCFVVRAGRRRRGVATVLLGAAADLARSHGATSLEGHPVDVDARSAKVTGSELFHGARSTFVAAGFTEVGRTSAARPVMERAL